jgi:glutamate/tyrosine decarboxylase-like PLP-dependent enzyme
MGLLVSGGSMATLTALAVARQVKAGWDVRTEGFQGAHPRLIVYAGAEGHGCARKAVELLGLGGDNLRVAPVDEQRRMRVEALEALVEQDRAAGHRPIAVVANAGTVNTGAIDPLAEIAALCRRHDLWLHVDGAYGAPAILTQRYRDELAPLSLADSLALDPHKWLYVPVEAGLVLVRDGGQAMRDTFSLVPPYLRTDGSPTGVGGPPWFSEFGFQQTRGFRALKVWMALKHHGVSGYAAAIEHDCALAGYLAERIAAGADLELMAANLSIVCFRYLPPMRAHDAEQLNSLNKAILQEVQMGGRAFLSSTVLDGRFVLRACIVNPRATAEDIDIVVDTVRSIGARLVEAGSAGQ